MVKVGYIQNSPLFEDKEKNFDQVRKLVGNVKADLLVLPELFATGYTFTSKEEVKNLADNNEESVNVVEIDITKADNKMITKFNDVLKDRKGKFYK